MQTQYTKDGIKVIHDSGLVIVHTKAQLQTQISSNQQAIDRLANDNLRLSNNIEQIETAGG